MNIDHLPPTDPTEDWLRQTLDGFSPEAPDNAWQRLSPHLPRRSRRRPALFWFFWSAVGTAAIFALLWWLCQPKAPRNKDMESLYLTQSEQTAEPEGYHHTNDSKIPSRTSGFFSPHLSSPKQSLSASSLARQEVKSAALQEHGITDGTIIRLPIATTETSKILYPTDPLPIHTAISLSFPQAMATGHPITGSLVLAKKAASPRFRLGIQAAPSIFMYSHQAGEPGALAFHESHPRPGRGWQAGVSLSAELLPRWRVGLGVQYMRQMHEATHMATLRLMDGVCINPNDPGVKEFEFRYSVISGAEQNDLSIRLQQQDAGSTMPIDEPFTLDMQTIHRMAVWRVPITLEHRFRLGRWQGFLQGGAVVDYPNNSTIEVEHFTEACQDLCFKSGHMPMVHISTQAKTSVGWLAGAGFEYPVSRHTALRFEPFFVGKKGSIQCGLGIGLHLSP